ncbi:MAG: MBOAT family O-acyltransferase [Eubacteriales bacterium]|nr:MBOAT family O-acyltransferase [Eubacteriales bacterium]
MLFSSMSFLWIFLPITICTYYLIGIIFYSNTIFKIKIQNLLLLILSFLFYAYGGVYYVLIMITTIIINFFGGKLVYKNINNKRVKKIVFIITIILNLLILFIFKYFNMFVIMIEQIIAGGGILNVIMNIFSMKGTGILSLPYIVLPIGISFFTFQSMSYVCDVYMGAAKVQKNIFNFALYVSLFPQLIAGPIVRYADIDNQLINRDENYTMVYNGIRRFIYGFAKKILIANNVALVADLIFQKEIIEISTPVAWLGAICYTIQIYYDFSGYSDMAIGLGYIFGFKFKENFNYPYTSLSIQDFWRRWHISLSTWFKEYVYIPLGGSRSGTLKTYRNLIIVFLLTGIWHGANWTFLFWGICYGLILIIERLGLNKLLEKNKFKLLNRIYVCIITLVLMSVFRSDNISYAFEFIKVMFSSHEGIDKLLSFIDFKCFFAILFGFIGCGFIQQKFLKKGINKINENGIAGLFEIIYLVTLLIICILSLISGTYNPFIYFQF